MFNLERPRGHQPPPRAFNLEPELRPPRGRGSRRAVDDAAAHPVHTGAVTDARAGVPDAAALGDAQAARMAGGNPDHPAAHSSGLYGLALGALGIVFGDIGTSPLYAMQTVFSIDDGAVKPTAPTSTAWCR